MTRPADPPLFPGPGHNHGSCLDSAVARAEQLFERKGLKLTPLRRLVLREIAGSHVAMGAYDVLERLARKGDRLAPISVYRAIDALLEAGAVHRLESRNAFFACHVAHGDSRRPVVLACDRCGLVAEVEASAIFAALTRAAEAAHFKPSRAVVEINGMCGACQQAAESGATPASH